MIYDAVVISGVQKSDSAIHIHVSILFQILSPYRLLKSIEWASQVALVGKNLSANAGDVRDLGSTPGLGRSPGGGHYEINSSFLAWRIPLTEEPGGVLGSWGSQRVKHDSAMNTHRVLSRLSYATQ